MGATSNVLKTAIIRHRFNSRTRVGATRARYHVDSDYRVSIHAPVWVRRQTFSSGLLPTGFNSRTRVGATFPAVRRYGSWWKFQFTHPCGCDKCHPGKWQGINSFNSRTRVGATHGRSRREPRHCVSIHAPVWVRLDVLLTATECVKFQFTHPCGCDILHKPLKWKSKCFNSRTRVGATEKLHQAQEEYKVSIHAPVWVRLDPKDIQNQDGHVSIHAPVWVRRPDEYGLSIKHATKVLRQPDARTGCGQA